MRKGAGSNGSGLAGTAVETFVPTLQANQAGTFTHGFLEPLIVDVGGSSIRRGSTTGGLERIQGGLGGGGVTGSEIRLGGDQVHFTDQHRLHGLITVHHIFGFRTEKRIAQILLEHIEFTLVVVTVVEDIVLAVVEPLGQTDIILLVQVHQVGGRNVVRAEIVAIILVTAGLRPSVKVAVRKLDEGCIELENRLLAFVVHPFIGHFSNRCGKRIAGGGRNDGLGGGGGFRVVLDVQIITGIQTIHDIDGGTLGADGTLDAGQQHGGGVEVGLDLVVDLLDGFPGGTFGLVVLQDDRNTQIGGRIAVPVCLAVKTDQAQVSVSTEVVAFTAHDGRLSPEVFRDILLQAVDDDVVAHDGVIDVLPMVLGIVVRGGEGIVRAVDGAVVVTIFGHGIEAVAHDFGSDVVDTVQGPPIVGEHTILESRQVAVIFQQLIRVVRNGVEGRQVQVTGSEQGNSGAESKYIDDLFHNRSVLSVRT